MAAVSSPATQRLKSLTETAKTIPRKVLVKEPGLMLLKWPAYRFMSPREATDLFTTQYRSAASDWLRANIDIGKGASFKAAVNLKTDTNNDHYTQMWKARQQADELGVPYEAYLRFCFHFAGRRKRRALIQPNQLGPGSDQTSPRFQAWITMFKQVWTDERRDLEFNQMAPMVQYCSKHAQDLPAQLAYLDQLDEVAQRSLNRATFVMKRRIERQEVSTKWCVDRFGKDVVRAAVEQAADDEQIGLLRKVTYKEPHHTEFWQACFGVVGVDRATSAVCAACPQRSACEKMVTLVERVLVAEVGTVDPIADKCRWQQRERTARFRAKHQAQAGTPKAVCP